MGQECADLQSPLGEEQKSQDYQKTVNHTGVSFFFKKSEVLDSDM